MWFICKTSSALKQKHNAAKYAHPWYWQLCNPVISFSEWNVTAPPGGYIGNALLLTFRRVNSEATTFRLFLISHLFCVLHFSNFSFFSFCLNVCLLLSREWISSLSPCLLAVQGLDSVPLQFAQPLDHLSAGGAQSHKPLSRAHSEPLPQSPHALHTHLLQQQHNTQLLERLKQQTHLGKVGIHVHLSVLFEIIHDLLFATFASRLIKLAACNLFKHD